MKEVTEEYGDMLLGITATVLLMGVFVMVVWGIFATILSGYTQTIY